VKRLPHAKSFGRWLAALALVALAGLAAAGCGSDSSSGGDTTATRKPPGTPIKIGVLDPSLGAGGITQSAPGAKAAFAWLNEHGGIGGHPVDVVVCQVDNTPEKNIACGNTFAQEKVAAVVDGFDFGAGAILPILHSASIPIVGPVAFTPQGETDTEGSFYFASSQAAFSIAPMVSFKEQGLKHVAFTQIDAPSSHAYFEHALIPAAQALGLTFTPVYYPPASPNFQTIASTLAATKADVAGAAGLSDDGQCTALAEGLRNVGFTKTIFAGFCTAFASRMGEKLGDAEIYSSVWLPEMKQYAPADVQQQLDDAEAAMASVPDDQRGYYGYATYAVVMTLAKVIEGIDGRVDAPSITAALRATKDMPAVLGAPITCDGSVRPGSSSCVDGVLMAKAQPDGSFKPLNGGFQPLPPEYAPKPPAGGSE